MVQDSKRGRGAVPDEFTAEDETVQSRDCFSHRRDPALASSGPTPWSVNRSATSSSCCSTTGTTTLSSTLSPSRSKVFYLLPTRLLVKPITHSRSGKPMFPQPVQYGFHALKCFSFSIPASSIISSSFSSTIFAFSSMRFGAMDFGMTDTRKCFIRTNHKDQLYDGSMPTGHSEAVRVQGNENI